MISLCHSCDILKHWPHSGEFDEAKCLHHWQLLDPHLLLDCYRDKEDIVDLPFYLDLYRLVAKKVVKLKGKT